MSDTSEVQHNRRKWVFVYVAILLFGITLIAPFAAPYDPLDTNTERQLESPSMEHPFGTDDLGRDVFSRFLHGGRHTMVLTTGAAFIALSGGIALGMVGSLEGRGVGTIVTIFINALLAIPLLIFGLALITLGGTGSFQVMLATGIGLIAPMAVFTKRTLKEVQAQTYVTAGISLGSSRLWMWRWYYLPNMRSMLLAFSVVIFAYCLINNAALSFLGLGAEPAIPEWGRMLAEGRYVLRSAPWVALASGAGLVTMTLVLNMVARRAAL